MKRQLAAILSIDVAGSSAMMERDEETTLSRLRRVRTKMLEPAVAAHDGHIIKLLGDGALIGVNSAVNAVNLALAFQGALAEGADEPDPILCRVGLNIGDVIVEENDIFGDGVNVAARLQSIARPGSICASADVVRHVDGKVEADFRYLGSFTLKNMRRPVEAFEITPCAERRLDEDRRLAQDIRFCQAADGVRIAYASLGLGAPVIKAANWLNHLEYDWESPVWQYLFAALSDGYRFIRYDERGTGLSDWAVDSLSLDSFISDLDAVAQACGEDRFALVGISQGAGVSIAYAVAHPERVSCLILIGGYAQGWRLRGDTEEIARREALIPLVKVGWGQNNPAFRQVFTSMYIPGATTEQAAAFNDLQRRSASPSNAVRLMEAMADIDVRHLLPKVRVPTLVLHSSRDFAIPIACGMDLARAIPDARFVPLDSDNHLILRQDPAWPRFVAEIRSFLAECATR